MDRSSIISIALSLLTLSAGCSRSEDGSHTHSFRIYEENGVAIAETRGAPKYQGELFEYQEVLRLQQDESNQESLVSLPWGFTMDDEGSFFILDGSDRRILVFSSDGTYSHSIGRLGSGPGELRSPRDIVVYQDTLSVYDGMLRRASLFRTDGSFLTSVSSPKLPPFIHTLSIGPNGELICIHPGRLRALTGSELYENRSVLILSALGDTIATLETPGVSNGYRVPLERYNTSVLAEEHFNGYAQAEFVPGNGIFITTGEEPWIRWYDLKGNLTRIIRVDIPRDPVSRSERDLLTQSAGIMIENAADDRARAIARKKKEFLRIPEFKDYWSRVVVDDDGYIWTEIPRDYLYRLHLKNEWRVFSPEGEYLGRTTWPDAVWSVSHGHLLLVVQDEYSLNLLVYSIHPIADGLIYP